MNNNDVNTTEIHNEVQNETSTAESENKPAGLNAKQIIGIISCILVVIIAIKCLPGKYDTAAATGAELSAQEKMAYGLATDEVKFEFVASKDDSKFIIRCTAKSDTAKEYYELLYGTNTVYFAYSRGYGYTYTYGISDSQSGAKEKINW